MMRTKLQVSPSRIPAAQYVRMSDEGQQFSIENQKAAIHEYAQRQGFEVVKTYADAGKSGVVLKHRDALRELLQDVLRGDAGYKAILVYDVSRWGRFPNNDEGAHYEFVCTQAGIPLHYCAEPFANDGTPSSSLLKALKRSMAAEFSRELSEKVFRGKSRLVRMGYWVGAQPGYGYRRMMVSADGKRKQKLKEGEHKSLTTDRIVLVLGPRKEVECVRHMFSMVMENRHGCTAIARDLNQRGIDLNGRLWTHQDVFNIVTNPKYMGCNVWFRGSERLRGKRVRIQPESWVTKPGAFPAIVDQRTFEQVQATLPRDADRTWTDEEILGKLKRLFKAKGRLSERMIMKSSGMPAIYTIHRHLGSYRQIYKKVGYEFLEEDMFKGEQSERSLRLHRKIVRHITDLFPGKVVASHLPHRFRSILLLNDGTIVSLLLCRSKQRARGKFHWAVDPAPAERDFITLVCRMNLAHDRVYSYYLFPRIKHKSHQLYRNDPWLAEGIRLKNLSEFLGAIETIRGAVAQAAAA
jgi:DNA invertase Pin-like site-specific DNA recombinase